MGAENRTYHVDSVSTRAKRIINGAKQDGRQRYVFYFNFRFRVTRDPLEAAMMIYDVPEAFVGVYDHRVQTHDLESDLTYMIMNESAMWRPIG